MSVEIADGLPGMDEASAELDRLMAEEAAAAGPQTTDHKTTRGAPERASAAAADLASATTEAQRAGQTAGDKAQSKTPEQLEAEKQKAETEAKSKGTETDQAKADEKAKAEAGKSRYAKAQERLQGGWEELNAGKSTFKAEQDAWQKQRDAEKAELQRQRDEFEKQRGQAEQEFTPDQYEQAAKKFEAEGKFDLADLAKQKAEALRRNPPKPATAKQAELNREWALKAGTDFPELAKENSPLQLRVAQLLKEEPDLKAHPKGIYMAARIADLEAQVEKGKAAQTTVAAKDKELEQAKKRITELEQFTAPGGGDGVTRLPAQKGFEQMSGDEQFAELEREAREMGVLVR